MPKIVADTKEEASAMTWNFLEVSKKVAQSRSKVVNIRISHSKFRHELSK